MPPQSFPSAAFSFLWSLYSAFDFRLVTNAEGSGLPYEVSPFGVGIFGLLGNGLQSDFFTDTVDKDIVVVLLHAVDRVFQNILAAHNIEQAGFHNMITKGDYNV